MTGPNGSHFIEKGVRLGILKGGQLARMLLQPCIDLGITPHFMDTDPAAPVSEFCPNFTVGNNLDCDDVYNFGRDLDVVTLEFENVNLEALRKLQADGIQVHPGPDLLAVVQDKGLQKEFYKKHSLPTADFILAEDRDGVAGLLADRPVIQKKRLAGYDGNGVVALGSMDDIDRAFDEPSVVEDAVDIDKEISVIVARNASGDVAVYPTVEMVVHPGANMLDYLYSPARISDLQEKEAGDLARDLAGRLGLVGLLAVEMFIDRSGRILINEIAPRPHNSGHHTIEANITSQFEQHVRAVLDLPLGSTAMRAPAAMVNIVGEPGHEGPVCYEGLREIMETPGIHVHKYGKKSTRPFRKMGHVTIVRDDLDECLRIASTVKQTVKAVSCQT